MPKQGLKGTLTRAVAKLSKLWTFVTIGLASSNTYSNLWSQQVFFSVNLLTLKWEVFNQSKTSWKIAEPSISCWNVGATFWLRVQNVVWPILDLNCGQFSPTCDLHVCVRRMYCWQSGCPKDYAMSLTAPWRWQRICISPMRWFMHYWCAAPVNFSESEISKSFCCFVSLVTFGMWLRRRAPKWVTLGRLLATGLSRRNCGRNGFSEKWIQRMP